VGHERFNPPRGSAASPAARGRSRALKSALKNFFSTDERSGLDVPVHAPAERWAHCGPVAYAWPKDKWGLGQYNRCQHELLLLGRRGKFPPPAEARRPSSVIKGPRGRHSAKPEAAYELIERSYPRASKLELFARGTARPGWVGWGNEASGCEAAT
jgi:MT-A70